MNILITGSEGFVGKNLRAELRNNDKYRLLLYDLNSTEETLKKHCQLCDFVIHLAGVNRPKNTTDFMEGNYNFTEKLLYFLKKAGNNCPVLVSSSTQADLNNPYGLSKKAVEDLVFTYSRNCGVSVMVYRFPNIFGKWCQPNYNSAIATFCYNLNRNIPVKVNDPEVELSLVYIDDVVNEILQVLQGREHKNEQFCDVPITYKAKLREIVSLLEVFAQGRINKQIPDMADSFTRKLYSTFISYIPPESEGFRYPLKTYKDDRGSFTEILRTPNQGQISVNIIKPGFIKGNHWHHSKIEKFLVIRGTGVIRFRKVETDQIYVYQVNGGCLDVVDIPPGYTHNIENNGDIDMELLIWASECYNPEKPDTFYLEV